MIGRGKAYGLVNCYGQADDLRKEILARPLMVANTSKGKLQQALKQIRAIETVDELQTSETNLRGGLLSDDFAEQANSLLSIMNGK